MKKLLVGLTALLLSACNPWQVFLDGTQGMRVHLGDFTAGTTRHPRAYDDLTSALEQCARRYVASRGASTEIDVPLDSLVSGIWIVSDWAAVADLAGTRSDTRADGIYQRDTHRLFLSRHAYRLRDEVQHEIGHALSTYYPALRAPQDTLNQGGEYDHGGAFFHMCVSYNPGY